MEITFSLFCINLLRRLETLTEDDHRKAEEFIRIMKPLYTSSLCVSADKSPTCSQIFPILKKLEAHFETQDEDTLFTTTLKGKIWGDLSTYYKVCTIVSTGEQFQKEKNHRHK